ncbi:MAG: 5'-nucleotidase C-terminal domain-containing protein [Deltaproteobacteria bacterium]|nr:5'-nucleotidase C-terminal domain-containing protein [Deltaproteobacteria bacterium]
MKTLRTSAPGALLPLLLVLSGLARGGPAGAQEAQPLAVSSGLRGDLVPLECRAEGTLEGRLRELSRAFAHTGDSLRIDAGDLLGASTVTALATRRHLDALAEAVASLGLRGIALGHRDLAAPRSELVARANALRARSVPVVLSNLRCDPSARALCDAVADAGDPPVLLASRGGPVALVALIAPTALQAVARDRAEGVELTDPAETLGRMVLAARSAGATQVVAIYDPDGPGILEASLRLVRGLPLEQRPDLFFVHDLSQRIATVEIERGAPQRLFATEPGRVLVTDLARRPTPEVAPPDGDAPPAVDALATSLQRTLCEVAGERLAGAGLVAPLDREGFTTLLLDVLREDARAELAVINAGAVRPLPNFPLRARISRLDVLGALPFEDTLRVGAIKGSDLEAFLRSDRAARFRVRGAVLEGDSVQVNGRPLEANLTYRVVTSGFVADGGDGGLGDDVVAFSPWGTEGPRDVLLRWLGVSREGDIMAAPVDPSQRTRWTFRFFVDTSWSETSIANTPNYQDPQLARAQGTAIQGDVELRASAEQPRYTLDNTLRLRLGFQRTLDMAGDTGLQKIADLITLRNQFGLRAVWRTRRWWHPIPYLESYTESEFQPPDVAMSTREFHHLQWRPTAGVRFELPLRSNVNLGGGVDWETLEPGAGPRPVVVLRGELPPTVLFKLQDREVEGQLFTELAYRDPLASTAEAIMRLTARLSVPLFEPLSVSVTYDLFGRLRSGAPSALAHDLNLGLQLDLLRTVQLFGW